MPGCRTLTSLHAVLVIAIDNQLGQFLVMSQRDCFQPSGQNAVTGRQGDKSVLLGVVHNCHHFHERTQRMPGGGGEGVKGDRTLF